MDSYGHFRFSGEIPEIPGRSQASSPVDQTAKLFEPGIEGLVALAHDPQGSPGCSATKIPSGVIKHGWKMDHLSAIFQVLETSIDRGFSAAMAAMFDVTGGYTVYGLIWGLLQGCHGNPKTG